MNMESDTDMDSPAEYAGKSLDQKTKDLDSDSVERPVSITRRLCSGLLGLIVLLLGVALVVGHAAGLIKQEPHVFMLVLIGVCMLWMLWYLLWVRTRPSFSPPRDHYAVKAHVTRTENATCHCTGSAACTVFKKVFEVLNPFIKEYHVMASSMIYIMWTNVGRKMNPGDHNTPYKLTAHRLSDCRIFCSRVFGGLVLLVGATFFILYQIFEGMPNLSSIAILLFYSYHIATLPLMFLYSLAGMLFHRRERRVRKGKCTCNWTCSKNVLLLLGASLGQLTLSCSSLLTAFSVGIEEVEEGLDLSYSILSLLEIILQNIFILVGLHKHPSHLTKKKKKKRSKEKKQKKDDRIQEKKKKEMSLLEEKTPASAKEHDGKTPLKKKALKEIYTFLIISNVMLWVIPEFGVHPQFENGIGRQYFGILIWFVLVILCQPLSLFYRMHSTGLLTEILHTVRWETKNM
ncbi:proton channel OTOP3-like [Cheilinus undulatus]|uniref:proton channel OTOP3-like n=1 Tax=Cheilinus undulatus TaxID=241271 RepID=UPI001BD6A5AE|nr:proton channel OTOP3-like [Cheilinus undulatus]